MSPGFDMSSMCVHNNFLNLVDAHDVIIRQGTNLLPKIMTSMF